MNKIATKVKLYWKSFGCLSLILIPSIGLFGFSIWFVIDEFRDPMSRTRRTWTEKAYFDCMPNNIYKPPQHQSSEMPKPDPEHVDTKGENLYDVMERFRQEVGTVNIVWRQKLGQWVLAPSDWPGRKEKLALKEREEQRCMAKTGYIPWYGWPLN